MKIKAIAILNTQYFKITSGSIAIQFGVIALLVYSPIVLFCETDIL